MLQSCESALISFWDESPSGFELSVCYEIRNRGSLNLPSQQRFSRSQAVVARVVAGETLVVPVRAQVGDLGSIYKFNGTGTLIWKLLETPKTVAEMSAVVAQEYRVDSAQAACDVTRFLSEMSSVGLVEVPAVLEMAGD